MQERILAIAEKVKNPPTWWWKVLGGIIAIALVIWINILLNERRKMFAAQRTELAQKKLAAEQAAIAAKVEADEAKRRAAEIAANAALIEAKKEEEALTKAEAAHELHVKQLDALADKDWDALNKLAGVK